MLYEILKTAKLGAATAPDMFTGLLAQKMPFAKGGEIAELSGVPPLRFKSNGEPLIDWKISGNTVQNGTPTPSNPVEVNGVGVRTENLLDYSTFVNDYWLNNNTGLPVPYNNGGRIATTSPIDVTNVNNVTFYFTSEVANTQFMYSLFNGSTFIKRVTGQSSGTTIDVSNGDTLYLCLYRTTALPITISDVSNAMLNTGTTAKPFEPYGYKIPITCGGVTTDIYIGDSPLYDGDTISMTDTGIEISTAYGNNVLTVGTTVQPSEVYIKYKK